MTATRLLMETRIQDGLHVKSQEFMRVSLLAYPVATPYCWQRSHDGCRVRPFVLGEVGHKFHISALIARLTWSFALLYMFLAHAELM